MRNNEIIYTLRNKERLRVSGEATIRKIGKRRYKARFKAKTQIFIIVTDEKGLTHARKIV